MTDITELARERLKEKFDAWWEREYKHLESSKYTDAVPHIKYGFWMAYQAGGAELVEALEKAQQVDEELCRLLPLGAEYMDPPDGGDVTPLEGVRRMVADYRQRIAELESRTVKLPPTFWYEHDDLSRDVPVLDKRLVKKMLREAGIKVEAE